jgi:hypothetical protein
MQTYIDMYIYMCIITLYIYIGHMYIIYVDIKKPEDFQGCFFQMVSLVSMQPSGLLNLDRRTEDPFFSMFFLSF